MNTVLKTTLDSQRRVRILSDQVVNQIAAGEVVERPASVVKELIENAVDAGASVVTVVIANGGRTHIEVIDNGCGMTHDDALLAIERFGTSKISSVGDLESIATHGFRGEALPSIASVSRFTLQTSIGDDSGTEINIEGGKIRAVNKRGFSRGTRVTVRHLFFNIPARRKFLRSEATEEGVLKAVITDFALSYPNIRFLLNSDGKDVLSFPPGADFFSRALELKIAGSKPVRVEEVVPTAAGPLLLKTLVSQPIEAVSGSNRLRLLVNHRAVRDKLLLRALRDGYGNFLKPGKYPLGILSLEIPPSDVDVNVHPQKTEVRFRRSEVVFATIVKALSKALATELPITELPIIGAPIAAPVSATTFSKATWTSHPKIELQEPLFVGSAGIEQPTNRNLPENSIDLSTWRFVGQIFHCYLLLEGPDMFAIVDMHAAHERVRFYQLKTQLLSGSIKSQLMLIPETITLPPEKITAFSTFQTVLEKMGIEAELFGQDKIIVRALPSILKNVSARAIFSELIALPDWSDWSETVSNAWDSVIARLACHGSVRSGRDLERDEVYALISSLQQADSSGYCPHGRPIVKLFRLVEFEAMFGRIQ